jgi:hypothetical protein
MIKQDGVAADFPLRGSHQIGSSRLSAYCSVCCQAPGLSSTSAVSHREAELNLSHLSTHNGIICHMELAHMAVMYHDVPLQPFILLRFMLGEW